MLQIANICLHASRHSTCLDLPSQLQKVALCRKEWAHDSTIDSWLGIEKSMVFFKDLNIITRYTGMKHTSLYHFSLL